MKRSILLIVVIAGIAIMSCQKEVTPQSETTKKAYIIATVFDMTSNEFRVMRFEKDGSNTIQLFSKVIPDLTTYTFPKISSDGKKLVYAKDDSIFIGDITSKAGTFIYKNENISIVSNNLNSNGSKIVFTGSDPVQHFGPNLYIMNAAVGALPVKLTNFTTESSVEEGSSFSPDGKKIAFSVYNNSESGIYVCNVDGSNIFRVSEAHSPFNNDLYPVFSNDMSKIVFISNRYSNIYEGKVDLVMADATQGSESSCTRLTNLSDINKNWAFGPSFSVDGNMIYFLSSNTDTDYILNLYKIPATGGTPVAITNNSNPDYYYLSVNEIEL